MRRASEETGRAVGVLVDLQGPKIRLGRFSDGPHLLAPGDVFTITTEDVAGTKDVVGTTYAQLAADVAPGDTILVNDGKVRLRVLDTDGVAVRTEVVVGGEVSNNKGINLPGVAVTMPALSEKDEADLRWALRLGADLVALSFVRSPKDAHRARVIMAEEGRDVPLIAKIEQPEAVDSLQEIIDAFDGVMVTRGDLGVELPLEAVPDRAEARDRARAALGEARHRRDADARVDDREPGADARRDERRRERRHRRRGRRHALGRDRASGRTRSTVVETMARIIASTEEHGLDRIPPLGYEAAHAGRRDHARRGRGRRVRRREVPLRLQPVGRHRSPDVAAAASDSDRLVHRSAAAPATATP